MGAIDPVDPTAQKINFQLNLPTTWNGKVVQYGGGGFNGTLVTATTALRDAAPDDPLPLTRGYATLGTDSGHQASAFAANAIGQFGLNDEMLVNYGYASYRKVKDVAVALMQVFYGKGPSKTYYFGGSEGGREGLAMAQRFPNDYDGIVSVVPVVQLSMLFASYIPHAQPQFNGGWLNAGKVRTLAKFVSDNCDTLDGLADGVVNNYLACPSRVNLQGIRCAGGVDVSDACLSDPQIATVTAVHTPHTYSFPLANGLTSYPQWMWGNESSPDTLNGVSSVGGLPLSTMTRWVTGTAPPTVAVNAITDAQQWLYGSNFVRYFITRDPTFDARTYDANNYKARVQQVSEIIDASDPNLSAFFTRGGKLIMRENIGDLAQSPLAGINYFNAVAAKVGTGTMEQSARLYISPASNHSGPAASVTDGSAVPTMVDLLDPLDRWVTAGQPPADALTQTRKATTAPFALQASRPMCRFPNYPHYVGGDVKLAASYVCAASQL
nr:tannase/feruloyl esterase family alpha/beta hydrolase [Schlegelella koreensis]